MPQGLGIARRTVDTCRQSRQSAPGRIVKCNLVRRNLFHKFCMPFVFSTELGSMLTRFHPAEEVMMKDAETYRGYAADCRRMAKQAQPKDKEALIKMAEAWEERAQQAERAAK